MPFDPSKQSLDNVTQTLINTVGDDNIGTAIPPKLNGEFRVPFVTNLRLGPVTTYLGGTQYTLLWDEPTDTTNISHYNVYVVGALGDNTSPIGPYSSQASPCPLRVVTTKASVLTFFVQTQLSNGNSSELSRSPSVTGLSTAPNIGTITVAEGGTGYNSYANGEILIGVSSSGLLNKSTITPGTNINIVNGAGSIGINTGTSYIVAAAPYTILSTDFMIDCSAGAINVTLPLAATAGVGKLYCIINSGVALGTLILPSGADTIMGAVTLNVPLLSARSLRSNGISTWLYQ